MAEYLVDFYSELGRLFQSDRIIANGDDEAKLAVRVLASSIQPASYVIRRLEKSRNVVIRELKPPND